MHKSTIKSQVLKQFLDIEIVEIKKFKFGMFSIKVKKQLKRSTKFGVIFGETNFDKSENGVVLDNKISWL
jgi:hypothetical protein|tara:strand:+ start:121 stop:330 length:210 start_codon:yes stop_codon:yes gene_type:complete